jgi:alpha-beta hydrolase superfamily lysophospholipase
MRLELIVEKPPSEKRPTPIVFLHGMCQAAWVWQQHFTSFFAQHGYECYAMSLRGHGGSESQERIKSYTMGDYVNDLEQVINRLEKKPVVIAHSMGGLITQMYLKSNQIPAAVLIAPCPHFGILPFFLRYLKRFFISTLKLVVTQNILYAMDTTEKCRVLFFCKDTPEEIIRNFQLRLQDDSFVAFLQMCFLKLANPKVVKTPLLILGGTDDFLFPVREVEMTARAYGTEAVFFQNMNHNMLYDHGWQDVANYIINWLNERGL